MRQSQEVRQAGSSHTEITSREMERTVRPQEVGHKGSQREKGSEKTDKPDSQAAREAECKLNRQAVRKI